MDTNGLLEVAALGRPFRLGMLYDCRNDSLITGLTLWDQDDLVNNINERPKSFNEFCIVASESVEDKSTSLHVDPSLKASFLAGLVNVSGSAKYLCDNKTSKHQARVTLYYQTTTKFKELTMNHLGRGNVKHSYIYDNGIATHVVTGILYGAHAFFVFDQDTSDEENSQDIEGNLKMLIKKIPSTESGGDVSLDKKFRDNKKVEKFTCKFHGDFCLEKSPVSYHDAVEVYQSLPKLLGPNGEKAVPVRVWLLPLTILDSSAARLVRQISIRSVQETQSVLEEFLELEIRCNDAMKTTTAQQVPQIGQKIKTFQELCSGFKQEFQQKLEKTLPLIRGGREEEAKLAEILKKRCFSPFNSKALKKWMDCKEKELRILKSFTSMMINTKIVPSQNDLDDEVFDTEYAVCFVFTSLGSAEPYLSALENHFEKHNSENSPEPQFYDIEKEQWYLSKDATETLRHKAKLFNDFAETNKDNKNIKFLAVGLTDETHKGSSIYFYKDGSSVSDNFEPPSKPETVTVSDVNYNSVTLKISPPRFGTEGITSYCVEYCVHGEDGWQQKTASKSEEFTVSGLSPNTEYMFRCRAVTAVGLGPKDQLSDSSKTLPCSPPGTPQTQSNSSEISVSWKRPADVGQGVHILSYMVEYTQMDGAEKADLHWSQMVSGGEKVTISGLQSETRYAVRVRCDCGVNGRSKESVTVNVSTKKFTPHLSDIFKQTSVKMNSDTPSVWKLLLKEEDTAIRGCRRYSFGEESNRENRTVILFGPGTSTLINGMVNYILGVRWEDSHRFKIVDEGQGTQAESQISEIKVYKINHQEGFQIPHSLTIIDTPGFADTGGIGRGRMITQQLHGLFTNQSGVSEIGMICFVAQSALARLTPTQKHVFDSVLSIFGKDVAENIRILVTFADGQRPPVLEAINVSGVPCPKASDGLPVHFKFNNSALFAQNQSSDNEEGGFDEMFWNMGFRSMKRFFGALNQINTKSLTMTNEVLKERQHLENSVENLQIRVRAGLAKLEEVKEIAEKVKENEAEMSRNENFEIEVTVTKPDKVDISGTGNYITNCQQCHHTCHYPCGIPDDSKKMGCTAMDEDGNCTECPNKCPWTVHFNQKYKWEYKEFKEMRTAKDLKEKYLKAKEANPSIHALISQLIYEYKVVQNEVMELMKKSSIALNRLKEIALKPNPLSTPEYIDMLIESEKNEAKLGWKKRVEALIQMREKAEMMAKLDRGETLLETSITEQDQEKTSTKTSNNAVEDQSKTGSNKKGKDGDHHTVQDPNKDNDTDEDGASDQDQNEGCGSDQDQNDDSGSGEDSDTDQDQNEGSGSDQGQSEDGGSDQDQNEDSDTDDDMIRRRTEQRHT